MNDLIEFDKAFVRPAQFRILLLDEVSNRRWQLTFQGALERQDGDTVASTSLCQDRAIIVTCEFFPSSPLLARVLAPLPASTLERIPRVLPDREP